MNKANLIQFLDANSILFEKNVELKKRTWIHRGGVAELFISPSSAFQLELIVSFLYKESIDFLLVGHTSNLYILNECDLTVVVSTYKCRKFEVKGEKLFCEAGVGIINLSRQMIEEGIKGFEYLTGLPGTIGAALVNNSSCRENSIAELLLSAKVVLSDGTVQTFTSKDFGFEFRNSVFKKKIVIGTIISAVLRAMPGDVELMKKIAAENKKDRELRLEGHARNLGCTVNRCFINGKMNVFLRLILVIVSQLLRFFVKNIDQKLEYNKRFLCWITGYSSIAPYISSKNPIVFMWLDSGADRAFPIYLEFMKKVYKTDKLEIEIIK
jgi:UDP-N-acetylenolpyruvoylglucosamine reductase